MPDVEDRLTALEVWRRQVELKEAGASVESVYFVKRFDAIDARLDRYDSHIVKFLWTIAAAVTLATVGFVMRGGLVQ